MQLLQVGEELNALQTRELLPVVSVIDIDLRDCIPLVCIQKCIAVFVKLFEIVSECFIREVESVNANEAIRDELHVQGKGSVVVVVSQNAVLVSHFPYTRVHCHGSVSVFGSTRQVFDPAYIKVSGQGAGV